MGLTEVLAGVGSQVPASGAEVTPEVVESIGGVPVMEVGPREDGWLPSAVQTDPTGIEYKASPPKIPTEEIFGV